MKRTATVAPVIAALALLYAGQGSAAPVIDFTGFTDSTVYYGISFYGREYNLGYRITVSSPVTIDALGIFDADSDGLDAVHGVGIWTNVGVPLATAYVGPLDILFDASASGAGRYVYTSISPLTLAPGDYVLGAHYPSGTRDRVLYRTHGMYSNDPGASYATKRYYPGGPWFGIPLWEASGAADGYFGPAARLAPGIPEPAPFAPLALGLIAIAARSSIARRLPPPDCTRR